MSFLERVKQYWYVALVALVVLGIGYVGYGCGSRSRNAEVASLATQVAQSERTAEIKDGLYATAVVQMDGLRKLLDTRQAAVAALQKQLDDSGAQLLTTQQLVVKWKAAYEGKLDARQTDAGPSPSTAGALRKRVDFSRDFGPISVMGHTLTDPAEGFVSVTQTRPLRLTVSVARNRNGTWNSYVTSSEPSVGVDVTLGGVDPGTLSPEWRQRLWLDLGTDFLGAKGVSLGLSYHLDRVSVGARCSVSPGSFGCGLTVGYRLFK